MRRSCTVRYGGAHRKANVGMSNDKWGERPHRRKTKGSSFDVNQNRVSRDLRSSRRANLMDIRLIFLNLYTLKRGRRYVVFTY